MYLVEHHSWMETLTCLLLMSPNFICKARERAQSQIWPVVDRVLHSASPGLHDVHGTLPVVTIKTKTSHLQPEVAGSVNMCPCNTFDCVQSKEVPDKPVFDLFHSLIVYNREQLGHIDANDLMLESITVKREKLE